MNGKNSRVKGCWSRGMPRGISYYRSNNDNINPPFYQLPQFRQSLINNINDKQKNLLYKFQNYPYTDIKENFRYNSNTPYSIILLKQNDFDHGTVRIRQPGVYVLSENISSGSD